MFLPCLSRYLTSPDAALFSIDFAAANLAAGKSTKKMTNQIIGIPQLHATLSGKYECLHELRRKFWGFERWRCF